MRKKKNQVFLPIILLILVVGLSIGGLVLAQNLRRAKIDNPGDYTNQDDIPRVTAKEAYQAVTQGEAVLIDTRSAGEFQKGHALNAVNIPLEQIEIRLETLDPETWYITYCT